MMIKRIKKKRKRLKNIKRIEKILNQVINLTKVIVVKAAIAVTVIVMMIKKVANHQIQKNLIQRKKNKFII